MTTPNSITVDGVEYFKKTSGHRKIVVLDRGFVVTGNVTFAEPYVVITDCECIRVWGTTKGLGEIAYGGPTAKTKLDPQPTTRVHELQVVQIIDCEEESWTR